jgi:peptide/nickel transport system permease protein
LIHLLVAIFGPFLAPYSPSALVSTKAFAAPGEGGLLGTDYLGRDLLSRLLYGAAPTIGLALVATLLAFALGIGLGFVAGLRAGWADSVISRSVDVLMSFPPILLALIVIASLGTSTPVLLAMVAIVQAPRIARVARAIAMDIVAQDFVDVARARGESTFSMLRREILPNSLRPLSVEFGIRLTVSVLFLSSLSFLGLGLQPPAADWGIMVRENLSGLNAAALAALFPAAAIGSLTVAVNLVIDWLASRADRQIAQERGL